MEKLIVGMIIGAVITWACLRIRSKIRLERDMREYTQNGVYNPPSQHILILVDSLNLLVETSNPETYFSRYKLAEKKALYCKNVSRTVWKGLTCDQIYHLLTDPDKRDDNHRHFIDKLFSLNKEDRLTFTLGKVSGNMSEETLNHFVDMLGGRRYHFCKISFDDPEKLYTYITKDPLIKRGDMVKVTVGKDKEAKKVRVIDTFDAPLNDLDFPLGRLKCIDGK